jgi:glutathione S-transferase
MAELFLWDHPVSAFSQKVRIALREKRIPFSFETPKSGGSGNLALLDPEFVKQNQRLEVPTLIYGDVRVFDSTIILEHIEDKYSEVPLRAADAVGRAKARMIEDVCDSQYEAVYWGMGEIETFKRASGKLAPAMREAAKNQARQIQARLTEQLGDAEWFGGDLFGYADVCVWPFVNRSTSYGVEPDLGTPLRNWYERAKQRSSVKSVFEEFSAGLKGVAVAYEAL